MSLHSTTFPQAKPRFGHLHSPTATVLQQILEFRMQVIETDIRAGKPYDFTGLTRLSQWDRHESTRHIFIHEDDDPARPLEGIARINYAENGVLPYMTHFSAEQLKDAACSPDDIEFCRFLARRDCRKDGASTLGKIYLALADAVPYLPGRLIADIVVEEGTDLGVASYARNHFRAFAPRLSYRDPDYNVGGGGALSGIYWTNDEGWQDIRRRTNIFAARYQRELERQARAQLA